MHNDVMRTAYAVMSLWSFTDCKGLQTHYRAEAVLDGSQLSKRQLVIWLFCFIFLVSMPLLAPTLDNADPLFALVIIPRFCSSDNTSYLCAPQLRWRVKTQLGAVYMQT